MRRRKSDPVEEQGLVAEILLLTLVRSVLNTGLRFVYPFLPVLARGVGVGNRVLAQVLALRALAGLAGPVFGRLSDRHGRRPVLAAAMGLMALGCALPFLSAGLAGLALALMAIALAKAIFDPALQGRVSDRVPYASRGRALAATELSWAAALLLGAPACAWLISRLGWRGPFLALGLASLVGALVVQLGMPRTPRAAGLAGGASPAPAARAKAATGQSPLALLRSQAPIRALAAFIVCLMLGNELLLVVFGEWLESAFGLSLAALGSTAVLIGSAELSGELGVAAFADRLGKRRVVLGAGLVAVMAYVSLPLAASGLPASLGLLFLVFAGFEVCYVGALPIATELAPASRAATMSIVTAGTSLGRALGAGIGGWLFDLGGLPACAIAAASLTLIGLGCLSLGVSEPLEADRPRSKPAHRL